MNIVNSAEPRIKAIHVTDEMIMADLVDGRTISVLLVWSWRLAEATPEQKAQAQEERRNWRMKLNQFRNAISTELIKATQNMRID